MQRIPLMILLGLGCATIGVGGWVIAPGAGPAPAAPEAQARAAHTYAEAVRALDDAVENESARADLDPASWLVRGTLAQSYRSRAQLTGDYADYARAQDALDAAFTIAPAGAGPVLARAQLHASMHRWELMEGDLATLEHSLPKWFELAAAAGLRGEYAVQSGRYPEARAQLEKAMSLDPGPVRLFALGDFTNLTGDHAAADALFDQAVAACGARDYPTKAWVLFERGVILEGRGDLDGALTWLHRADGELSGWWRVQGQIAEVTALRGDTDAARASYQELVRSTGHPEFMDALARLALARGDADDARHWTAMGWTVYDQELKAFPEAACGHALDHVLDLSGDGALAVRLALENHRLRPGGEASVKLARAYLLDGRPGEARAVIEQVLATPYDVPTLHRAAAGIYSACGDQARAQQQTALAARL
jgi:tetratricopeptide (TPR) repeat protein